MDWLGIDYIKNETTSEEENKQYLRSRIIGNQEKGRRWLERFWRKIVISLELLRKRCSLSDGSPVDFYLFAKRGRKSFFNMGSGRSTKCQY